MTSRYRQPHHAGLKEIIVPEFAADVTALDLCTGDSELIVAALRRMLQQYALLIFHDQPLTVARHVELAQGFGVVESHRYTPSQLEDYPAIFRIASQPHDGYVGLGQYWHADGFGRATPTRLALYHMVESSPLGGETLFVDAVGAWRRLPHAFRARLSNLTWRHRSGFAHPFFRRHPASDAASLSVNLGQLQDIEGMRDAERVELVERLDYHLSRKCDIFQYRWSKDDVLIADNHALLHRATTPTTRSRRILHRVSVLEVRSSVEDV